jgi:hypothetical protein
MKPRFPGDKRITPCSSGVVKKVPSRATRDSNPLDLTRPGHRDLQPFRTDNTRNKAKKLIPTHANRQSATPARSLSLAICAPPQGVNFLKPQRFRKNLVYPATGTVKRGVGAVNGYPRLRKSHNQTALGSLIRQAASCTKEDWVMRHNQLHALPNSFTRNPFCQRQARHQPKYP